MLTSVNRRGLTLQTLFQISQYQAVTGGRTPLLYSVPSIHKCSWTPLQLRTSWNLLRVSERCDCKDTGSTKTIWSSFWLSASQVKTQAGMNVSENSVVAGNQRGDRGSRSHRESLPGQLRPLGLVFLSCLLSTGYGSLAIHLPPSPFMSVT